jgi:Tol biopolymer transport system component
MSLQSAIRAASLVLLLPFARVTPGRTQPALTAKVAEALMGPRTQQVYLSEDGDHLAIVAPKGSRQVLLIDGVEGPGFDEIPLNFNWSTYRESGGSMVFSRTGGHSAYVGRRGGDFIAVVDGKEATTLHTPATLQSASYSNPAGWRFWFSKDGSHLAYGALSEPASWVMVFDGVSSPPYRALDFRQTALGGKRLVYVAQTADQKWQAVVDGKPGPAYDGISGLKLTPDGAHYAYIAFRSGAGPKRAVAVIDGVETPAYYGIGELEQAPDGRVAYQATTQPGDASGRGGAEAVFVGGLSVSGTLTYNVSTYDKDRIGHRLGSARQLIAWSPDGKRFGYVQSNRPNPGVTVMVNGKAMGPTYLAAEELWWSPDGAHLTYQGSSPTGTVAVVDGQEFGGYTWVKEFQWSPDGNRYAFQAAGSSGLVVMVDGKEQPKTRGLVDGSILFSPDGKHLAYGGQQGVSVFQPVVDGVARPHNLQNFSTRNNPPILFPVFSWSPDGNHLAYVALTMDPMPKGGVFVDGTLWPGPSAGFQFPSWSPNSKHFATAVWTGRGFQLMVDGKLGPAWEDILVLSSAACRFVDDHTIRFYGIKTGQIYRVTVDLGA